MTNSKEDRSFNYTIYIYNVIILSWPQQKLNAQSILNMYILNKYISSDPIAGPYLTRYFVL